MSTHNVNFQREIEKNIPQLSLNMPPKAVALLMSTSNICFLWRNKINYPRIINNFLATPLSNDNQNITDTTHTIFRHVLRNTGNISVMKNSQIYCCKHANEKIAINQYCIKNNEVLEHKCTCDMME